MNAVRNYQKELDKIIERIGAEEKGAPTLFLHSCCAPCSSYVLEYLRRYFRITVFYYNPNITEDAEYRKRVAEQKRLIAAYNKELTEIVNTNRGRRGMTDVQELCGKNIGMSASGQEGRKEYSPERAADPAKVKCVRSMEEDGGSGHRRGYEIRVIEGDYEPACFFEMAKGLEQCPEGGERCFACYALRLSETVKRAKEGNYDYFTTTLSISPLKNAVKLNEIGERLAAEYGVAWLPSDFKKRDGYKRSIELSKEYGLYRQDYCGCVYSRLEREGQKKEQGS